MTTHALARLAKEAMGRTLEDCFEHLDADTFGAAHGDVWFGDSAGNVEVWRPHTDTAQAVALLEAWYQADEYRFYDIMRRPDPDRFAVALHLDILDIGLVAQTRAPTLAEAATAAVCAAMKINPEAEEPQ